MPALTWATLRAVDRGTARGEELRFCCPLPGCAGKAKTAAHRSLAVHARTGAYYCHRCGGKGRLTDATAPAPRPVVPAPRVVDPLAGVRPLLVGGEDAPAMTYLRGRGLGALFPLVSEVGYAPAWLGGGPAVVFPLRDRTEAVVAAQGRYLAPRAGQPRMKTRGAVSAGAFLTPNALGHPRLVICEAPIDALSLAEAGVPAVATCGAANIPTWLPAACRDRRVLIAHDPDPAGDAGAARLRDALRSLGIHPERLTPPAGDWNAYLQRYGLPALTRALADALG